MCARTQIAQKYASSIIYSRAVKTAACQKSPIYNLYK